MNMNKKQIIQIVVIVGAFGLAGFVLYSGLLKDKLSSSSTSNTAIKLPGTNSTSTSSQTVQSSKDILPYGDKLNFSILNDSNGPQFQFDQIAYPKLNSSQEVGINENNLITSSGAISQ